MFLLPRAAPLFLYQSMRKKGGNQLPKMQIAHKGSRTILLSSTSSAQYLNGVI